MGLEGFSMKNLGAYHSNVPSSHIAFDVKETAKIGHEKQIKDVDESEKWEKIDGEDSEEYSGTGGYSEGQQNNEENDNDSDKKFDVKLNPQTNLIELYDIENNKLIETITPQELITLIKNLNSASGILVNKKI